MQELKLPEWIKLVRKLLERDTPISKNKEKEVSNET